MAEAEDRAREDKDWQRLDKWLWCARLSKTRSACAALVERGAVRLNRQPVDKPHARLRPGDVLTLAVGGAERGVVKVWRVQALAERRGPPAEARTLYEELGGPPDGTQDGTQGGSAPA